MELVQETGKNIKFVLIHTGKMSCTSIMLISLQSFDTNMWELF